MALSRYDDMLVPVTYEALDLPSDVLGRLPDHLPCFLLSGAGRNGLRVSVPRMQTVYICHVVIMAAHFVCTDEPMIVVVAMDPRVLEN